MSEMISFGAGVNSVAMTIMLVNDGWHGPIVFADTGGERPETMCYLDYFSKWLAERGMEITTLSPGSEWHPKKASVPLEDYCHKFAIIPLLALRWCSVEWKRNPLLAWAKAHECDTQLLGICASEPQRVRDDPNVRYPLYEEGITRAECRHIIGKAGLVSPPKSSCFFCPGQTIGEWRRLYYDHPELFERARTLEENASCRHNKRATLNNHYSLDEMVARGWDIQLEMDLSRWLPCACSL